MTSAVGSAVANASANEFSISVARKALDVQEQQGQAAVELIQSASVSADGRGRLVDVVA